jgi:two-component system nitrogen regulation sensor histidine kinase GlnL
MVELHFCVNEHLRIISCCEKHPGKVAVPDETVQGQPYTRLLPPLVYQDLDALDWVIRNDRQLLLENVRLGERFCFEYADLVIEPLKEENTRPGARVTVRVREMAATAPRTRSFQRSEELEKLAVMLSHGVRNPLNAIKGAVTYLRSRFAHEPELGEFTGIMSEEILRLERFISGFLATASLDQPVPHDINALLKKITVFASLQARVSGVELVLDCGPVNPIRINPFQVEQAVLNLLNNAIAALPDGGRIRLGSNNCRRQARQFIAVEVADDGPGMAAAQIASLKDPASSPERGRERGFGLYITREVVQSHGGLMEIDSEPGMGTVVRLLFPVAGEGQSS